MKKCIVAAAGAAIIIAMGQLNAQAPKVYKLDFAENAQYGYPNTTVRVSVTLKKETIRTGPYARYAQKYLGVIAPLSDKQTYSIEDASLGYVDNDTPASLLYSALEPSRLHESYTVSHVRNATEFSKATPDRMTLADRSAEDMAREAASTIFTLRKRRFDLITGEAGEHVYGAGMKAALNEMESLENELLSLFLGKQSVEYTSRYFEIAPEQGKTNYIAFRFSPTEGALSADDLTGEPVVLMMQPEGKVEAVALPKDKKYTNYYRVADWAKCRLLMGNNELATARIPVYQFGSTQPGQ